MASRKSATEEALEGFEMDEEPEDDGLGVDTDILSSIGVNYDAIEEERKKLALPDRDWETF